MLRVSKILQARPEVWNSPAFKSWFRDSKAMTANGLPMVFYHGTSKDKHFDKFKEGMRGIWFTSNPQMASEYAANNDSQGFKYNSDTGRMDSTNTHPRVIPVYLRMENPYKFTEKEVEEYTRAGNYAAWQREFSNKIRAKGYDSVVYPDGSYVVFSSSQIKSAISSGFNPSSGRITASVQTEEYSDEDLKTDWLEIIDDIEWDIPAALIERITKLNNLHFEWKLNRKILVLNNKVWFLYDRAKGVLDYIKDIKRWVYELDGMELEDLVGDVNDLYNPFAEESLNDLRHNPGTVYHYTNIDSLKGIKSSGFIQCSSGSGLTNRSSEGVFTSLSEETNASGSYGDILLAIDLSSYLKDHPDVTLSWEPEIEECLMRDAIEGALGLEGDTSPDSSGGMSYDTVIVGGNIPVKYVKEVE